MPLHFQPRTCPHCLYTLPFEEDFEFDDKLNLVCGKCRKPVYPTSYGAESDIDIIAYRHRNSTTCTTGTTTSYNNTSNATSRSTSTVANTPIPDRAAKHFPPNYHQFQGNDLSPAPGNKHAPTTDWYD